MIKNNDVPGPGEYSVRRCLKYIAKSSPVYTLKGRPNDTYKDNGNPSPVHYNPIRTINYISPKSSDIMMKGTRTEHKEYRSPGPAYYKPDVLKEISLFKFTSEPRFGLYKDNKVPAPNYYDKESILNHNKRDPDVVFKKQQRFQNFSKEDVPGPGKYRVESRIKLAIQEHGYRFNRDKRFKYDRNTTTEFNYNIPGSIDKLVGHRYQRKYTQ